MVLSSLRVLLQQHRQHVSEHVARFEVHVSLHWLFEVSSAAFDSQHRVPTGASLARMVLGWADDPAMVGGFPCWCLVVLAPCRMTVSRAISWGFQSGKSWTFSSSDLGKVVFGQGSQSSDQTAKVLVVDGLTAIESAHPHRLPQ